MIQSHNDFCTGCSACMAICPVRAITMCPDEEGFSFPVINPDICTGCNLCEQVCPIDKAPKYPYQDYCYIAVNENKEELAYSSSGGVFPILSRFVLKNGGLVCGCILDEFCVARHVLTDNSKVVREMSGSKYVQSDMGNCYREIEENLKTGRIVLFSGTPCQVGGLRSFLGCEYDNLWCMDFSCYGVPSPLIWKNYVDSVKNFSPTVKSFLFRNKYDGWLRSSSMTWLDEKGDTIAIFPNGKSGYMANFYARNIMRKSCSLCEYCTPQRPSDFTVGDMWAINRNLPLFDDRGMSFILFNTSKALNWMKENRDEFKTLKRISLKIVKQTNFYKPSFRGKHRAKVFRALTAKD